MSGTALFLYFIFLWSWGYLAGSEHWHGRHAHKDRRHD